MIAWVGFGVVAAAMLLGAVMVVRTTDLVHAVLWLALTLLGTAVAFVMLQADFLAVSQVLLYTGGVVTLMLFAVMLTRRIGGARVAVEKPKGVRGVIVALAIGGLVISTVVRAWPTFGMEAGIHADSADLGGGFLTTLVLPFELLSMLLLAAMVAAIVLARKHSGPMPRPAAKGWTPPPGLPEEGA